MSAIIPNALYWASFNRFEMRIPGQALLDCSRSGACDTAVAHWAPIVAQQVETDAFPLRPTPDKVREELSGYGAWSPEELADNEANFRRIVWIAANDIAESESPDCTHPLND